MPDRPDIPEEAVEAAARMAWELSGPDSDACIRTAPKGDWPGPLGAGSAACSYMREILQAAAPALRSQGAEEAERLGEIADQECTRADAAERERDQALAKGAEEERERLGETLVAAIRNVSPAEWPEARRLLLAALDPPAPKPER